MANEFVQKFLAFSDPAERTEALDKLVNVLSRNERQVLIDAACKRNDLVPTLPPELLLEVFSYLPIEDTWSLQRVSRRWRDALSSDSIRRAALVRADTHDPSDSGRHADSVARDTIHDRIRHMQSLKFGKAFTIVEFDDTGTGLQGPHPQLSHRRLDLKGKNIAYIATKPGVGDAVVLRDLQSGSKHIHRGEARERILTVALSTDLMVFVTFDGDLYVVNLCEPGRYARRKLPSAHVRALGVDGLVAAVAMGQSGSIHLKHLLIFNYTLNTFQEFDIEGSSRKSLHGRQSLNSFSLLVDCRQESIDLFALTLWRDQAFREIEIVHFRTNFAGEFVSDGANATHYLERDEHVRPAHFTMAPPVPTGYRGRFRIQVGETPLLGGLSLRLKSDEDFDVFDCGETLEEMKPGFVFKQESGEAHRWEFAEFSAENEKHGKEHQYIYARWKTLGLRAT